jgi:hypothetical protein
MYFGCIGTGLRYHRSDEESDYPNGCFDH